jgi:hypothetical protein
VVVITTPIFNYLIIKLFIMTAYHHYLIRESNNDVTTLVGLILKDLLGNNSQAFDLFEEYETIGREQVYQVANKLLNN